MSKNYNALYIVFFLIANLLNIRSAAAQDSNKFGAPLTSDGLGNTTIGQYPEEKASIRFKAKSTGNFKALKLFLSLATYFNCPSCRNRCTELKCYAAGNGGRIKIELQTDDGTSKHNPSGNILATMVIDDPMNAGVGAPYFGNVEGTAAFRYLDSFNSSPLLQAGQLYHFVFSNISADPSRNYISLNNIYLPATQGGEQKIASEEELALLYYWHPNNGWENRYINTPIYELHLSNGFIQGQGYMGTRFLTPKLIAGESQAREVFKVSGSNIFVNGANIRLFKNGTPGSLNLRLESSNGELIDQCSVPAANLQSPGPSWGGCRFSSTKKLLAGSDYRLVIQSSVSSNGNFQVYPIQKGLGYGFSPATFFNLGNIEYNPGTGWLTESVLDWGNAIAFDYPFYLDLVPEPPPPINHPPSSPSGLRIFQK